MAENKITQLSDSCDSIDFPSRELKRIKVRATLPRIQVLTVFYENKSTKLSAYDIYRILSSQQAHVSLSTIYNACDCLAKKGLLLIGHIGLSMKTFELKEK